MMSKTGEQAKRRARDTALLRERSLAIQEVPGQFLGLQKAGKVRDSNPSTRWR